MCTSVTRTVSTISTESWACVVFEPLKAKYKEIFADSQIFSDTAFQEILNRYSDQSFKPAKSGQQIKRETTAEAKSKRKNTSENK